MVCHPPIDLFHSENEDGKTEKWLEGFGYDEAVLKEGRAPICRDLDEILTTQVVVVYHSSEYILACNSLGLKLAGITRE